MANPAALAERARAGGRLGIDTEFMAEGRYQALLCLVQVAVPTGVGDEVARLTERAMHGDLDFEQALRQRVALLAGLDASVLDQDFWTDVATHGVTTIPGVPHTFELLERSGFAEAFERRPLR